MSTTLNDLQDVLREVFDDEEISLSESTTAKDIDGWDSMMHINLIIAIEKRFGVKFAAAEIAAMKAEGQNLGTLAQLVEKKQAKAEASRR